MIAAHQRLADAVKWALPPISVFILEGDPRIHHNYKLNLLHVYCNHILRHTGQLI